LVDSQDSFEVLSTSEVRLDQVLISYVAFKFAYLLDFANNVGLLLILLHDVHSLLLLALVLCLDFKHAVLYSTLALLPELVALVLLTAQVESHLLLLDSREFFFWLLLVYHFLGFKIVVQRGSSFATALLVATTLFNRRDAGHGTLWAAIVFISVLVKLRPVLHKVKCILRISFVLLPVMFCLASKSGFFEECILGPLVEIWCGVVFVGSQLRLRLLIMGYFEFVQFIDGVFLLGHMLSTRLLVGVRLRRLGYRPLGRVLVFDIGRIFTTNSLINELGASSTPSC